MLPPAHGPLCFQCLKCNVTKACNIFILNSQYRVIFNRSTWVMNNARVFKLHSGPRGSICSRSHHHPPSLSQSQDISGLFIIQQAGALDASRWASSRGSFDFLPILFSLARSHVAARGSHDLRMMSQMSLSGLFLCIGISGRNGELKCQIVGYH